MGKQRRKAAPIGPAPGAIWADDLDLLPEPRRRSSPGPVTRLERIAERAGIDPDEYRLLLSEAIQERLRERGSAWERLDNLIERRTNES